MAVNTQTLALVDLVLNSLQAVGSVSNAGDVEFLIVFWMMKFQSTKIRHAAATTAFLTLVILYKPAITLT
jgi:hypothetical protein